MSIAKLYKIETTGQTDTINATEIAQPTGDWAQYASLSPVTLNQQTYLLGFKPAAGELDVYEFKAAAPWVKVAPTKLKVEPDKDILNAFTLGNRPYLSTYTAKNGISDIYALGDDLSLSPPLRYFRNREPAISKNFTTVKFFTNFGKVVMLGYDSASGQLGAYTLGVIASSPGGIPPLAMTPEWSHQWAAGWTRFAFFQFGGSNFFLKTNTAKPNVNIDHLHAVLSAGTVEVGTRLALRDAQTLSQVEPFVLDHGDPYFVTYLKTTGQVTLNRFWSDCLGWTTVAKLIAPANAGVVAPITLADGKVFLLIG